MSEEDAGNADLRQWIGRTITEQDELSLFSARGMAALLDRDAGGFRRGSRLPAGWHWLYFKPTTPQGELGDDGHARRGGFLPPVPLPRRMWAGGRLRFLAPLHLGEAVERVSTIRDVVTKDGRSGRLVFVTVHHAVIGPAGLACDEEQHLVYREANPTLNVPAAPAQRPAETSLWAEEFLPSNVALFRFSALTFNGHRIHYDHAWATEQEGYPGVVVHAPLTAMLLLDAAGRHGPARDATSFEYRAVSPLFAGDPIRLHGGALDAERMRIWASNRLGALAMTATAAW